MVKVLRSFVRGRWSRTSPGSRRSCCGRAIRGPRPSSTSVSSRIWIAGWRRGRRVGRPERAGDRAVSGRAPRGGVCGVSVAEGAAAAAGLSGAAGRAAGRRQVVRRGPVEELLGRYRGYLVGERGLTPGTARGYVDCVRPFVATRLRGDVARSGRDRRRPMSPGSCWPPARAGRSGRRS